MSPGKSSIWGEFVASEKRRPYLDAFAPDDRDLPALVCRGAKTSYRDLLRRLKEAKIRLEEDGITPGDVVALRGDFSPGLVALLFALVERRCITVPLTASIEAEDRQRLEEGRVKWLYAESGDELVLTRLAPVESHPMLEKLRERRTSGLILFSSGITGKPKAMVHDLNAMLDSYLGRKKRAVAVLVVLLFDHIGGLNTLFSTLAMGACLVVPERRGPEEAARLVVEHQIYLLPASPTFLNLMLMADVLEGRDLSCLRLITYGTEPMPETLLRRLKKAFPRARLLQTFGTSETGISQSVSKSSDSTLLKFTDPNTEYRVVDGELWLRSQTQILGYMNASMDQFDEDGWFHTGDLVEEHEGGYLRIIGRRVEMINVGGLKVAPTEVEGVLLELPEVLDCTVLGTPNPITGQTVTAQILLKEGLSLQEAKRLLRRHAQSRLDRYKVPTRFHFLDKAEFNRRFKKSRLQDDSGN